MFTANDYLSKATLAEKIATLKLHIVEVSALLASPTSQTIDGLGYSRESLGLYLKDLKAELNIFQTANGDNKSSNVTFLRSKIGRYM